MESHYTGSQPPPKLSKTEIIRVTTSEAQQFCILSKAIFGQWIHWYGNRSHECKRDVGTCSRCLDGQPAKFLGYLYVIDMRALYPSFLELTHSACDLLVKQAPPGRNLRGLNVRIKKTKGGPKGRYLVEVLERTTDPETLPDEKDPRDTLKFLWNCKKQRSSPSEASV